jgi:drug/metabolite transporter (DMT)-like permease
VALLMQVQLVIGDLYVLLATAGLGVLQLAAVATQRARRDPPRLGGLPAGANRFRPGLVGRFRGRRVGADGRAHRWGWPLAAALLYVAVGPAVIAYRCWGMGVQRVGPAIAGFFSNLTPLFAALLSAAFLGELPHLYHALAFVLIVGGIVVSSRR